GLLYEMFNTASEYPYASVNAYNPWALASLDGNGVAANGTWACDSLILHPQAGSALCTDAVMIGPVSAVVVGAVLLLAAFVIVCAVVAWRPTPLTLLVGLAVLAVAFFTVPTRVHERYLFPFMAIGAILAAASWRWLLAYVALSITAFLNMYVVLTTLYTDNPGIRDWLGIGSTLRRTESVTVIALVTGVVALWVFAQLRPGGIRSRAGRRRQRGRRSGRARRRRRVRGRLRTTVCSTPGVAAGGRDRRLVRDGSARGRNGWGNRGRGGCGGRARQHPDLERAALDLG